MTPRIMEATTPPIVITLVTIETRDSGTEASIEPEEVFFATSRAAPTVITVTANPKINNTIFVKMTLAKTPLNPNSPNHSQSARIPLPIDNAKINPNKMAANMTHFKRPFRPLGIDKLLRSRGGKDPSVIVFYLLTYSCSNIFT